MSNHPMPEFDPYLTWLGIPPHQRPPTHYQLLGVDPAIKDPAVIKTLAIQRAAYVRNFQRTEHSGVCTRILEELARAEAILTDPAQRADYDRGLKPLTPAPFPPKAVPAKAIAVPAPRPPQPPPARKPKRADHSREALAAVKWTAMAIVGVAIVIGVVSISRMFSSAPQGMLAVTFDEPWPDAAVTIDGRKIDATAGGARISLAPGEHLVAVERGALGTFRKSVTLAANAPSEVRVPASAFQSSTAASTVSSNSASSSSATNSSTVAVPAPKPLTVIYNPVPNDAEAVVSSGKATLIRDPNTFRLSTDAAAVAAGVDVTFSKKGFTPKTVRVKPDDASQAAVSVTLTSEARRTARLSVLPPYADVAVNGGEAKKVGDESWEVSAPAATESITVSALGYTTQKLAPVTDGATMAVNLRGSPTGVWDYYGSLDKDAILRLVGRAGSFGGSVRRLALSRNGKWLAVAEAGRPALVHLWDVDKAQFVGPVFHNQDAPDKSETPRSHPVAIAVSNDGRFIALSCLVVSIFDVQQGKEIKRFGKEPDDSSPDDALGLAFSGDGTQLFTSLRDGRIVVRDTKDWAVVETHKGFDADANSVRFSADGAFATGVGKSGLFLWSKEAGKKTVLEGRPGVVEPKRWSARPDDEYYWILPGAPDETLPSRNGSLSEAATRVSRAKAEFRRYGAPTPSKSTKSKPKSTKRGPSNLDARNYAIEALTKGRAAIATWRISTKSQLQFIKDKGLTVSTFGQIGDVGDWGLLIWEFASEKPGGGVYFPSMVYAMAASDDGRTLATVVEREHTVCLWKFNPTGVSPERFSQSVEWDSPPPRRWEARWTVAREPLQLTEKRAGAWELNSGDKKSLLKEKSQTPFGVVLTDGETDYHVFNSGAFWEHRPKSPSRSRSPRPDFQGDPYLDKETSSSGATWTQRVQGEWTEAGLEPRRAKSLKTDSGAPPGKAADHP